MKSAKSVLYVTTPGSFVHQNHGRLRVTRGSELVREVRLIDLDRVVVLSGSAGLTAGAATALMESGVECAFVSSTGQFRGFLSPARGRGVSLRLAQYAAYHDPQRRLEIARGFVVRKIRNSDVLLSRYARNHAEFDPAKERARLQRAAESAGEAPGIDLLLGYEGEASAAYFQAFGRMLGGGFAFRERSRRPPRDPANALLSFGYSLLASEAVCAVAGAGLDPALGMLHAPDDGRPALALDLMEPFRCALVDRLTLHLANNRILSMKDDFTHGADQGVRLSESARRRFLQAYEERATLLFHPNKSDDPISLRERLREEAHRLAHIPCDNRRRRVANTLLDAGGRFQKSCFECELETDGKLRMLLHKLAQQIRPAEDTIRVYRICGDCVRSARTLGVDTVEPPLQTVLIL